MKVLFFAPHSAIWIHAFPEALVAEALIQQGHEVVYVGCGGTLKSHCVSMSAYGVSFTASDAKKESICKRCTRNRRIIREQFKLTDADLADLTSAEDISYADATVEEVTRENFLDLTLEGVEIGRIALYELLLHNKKSDLIFSDAEWTRYKASLKNSLVVFRLAQKILTLHSPDRVVVYNSLYSVNRVVCDLAERKGITSYFLHAGDNLSKRLETLIVARGNPFSYYERLREKWNDIKDQPCSPLAMRRATDHFLEVIKGKSMWAYSTAPNGSVDLRKVFDIPNGCKVICATMSSEDERFSGEVTKVLRIGSQLMFPKQVDWIKSLISFVESREDLSLVIRVHPREFPNKRECVLSEHAKMLQIVFSALPKNVRINWPTDGVSLYDLASVADVIVNAWSSAGKEMAWLGLPVVGYSDELTLYPANLNYVGTTESDYFQKIEQALAVGWDPERIRAVYRWCAIEYELSSLRISESFSKEEVRPFATKVLEKIIQVVVPKHYQERNCRNRAKRLAASGKLDRIIREKLHTSLEARERETPVSRAEETATLKAEVGRLVNALYGNPENSGGNALAAKLRNFSAS
jgi:hypothetical protein